MKYIEYKAFIIDNLIKDLINKSELRLRNR